jgi:hypothetical protein
MSFKNTRRKIALLRESNIQNLLPYDSCIEKIESSGALLDFLEQQETETEIKQQARWYHVVMCVSAMEIYFKGMTEIFVQGGWIKDNVLEVLRQEKVSLADLMEINKENITLGEILSVSKSFQDLNSINWFYNRMLGCDDFVGKVSEFKVPLGKGKYSTLIKLHPAFRKDINSLVHWRHLAVHHDISKRILGVKELDNMTGSLIDFIKAADLYLAEVSDDYTEKPR